MILVYLILINGVGGLFLRGTQNDIRYAISNYGGLFKSLNYQSDHTLNSLPVVLAIDSLHSRLAYRAQKLPTKDIIKLYWRYIDIPHLHELVLPLELLLNHPVIHDGLATDWHRYSCKVYELPKEAIPLIRQEPWRSLILERVAKDPAMAGFGHVGVAAVMEGLMSPSLCLKGMNCASSKAITNMVTSYPLLSLVHLLYTDPYLHEPNILANNNGFELLTNFVNDPRNPGNYYNLLKMIRETFVSSNQSQLVYWHGKLVYLALVLKDDHIEADPSPRMFVVEFFTAYRPEEYTHDQLCVLALPILKQGLLLGPLEGRLESNLEAIYLRHTYLKVFWGNQRSLLRSWSYLLVAGNVLRPPSVPFSWLQACRLLFNQPGLLYYRFDGTLKLQWTNGKIVQCDDLYCLLKSLSEMLLVESNLLRKSSSVGYRITDYSEGTTWIAIGRLIVHGLLYQRKDPLSLNPRLWLYMYQFSNGTLPPRAAAKLINHCGFITLVRTISAYGLFSSSEHRYTL